MPPGPYRATTYREGELTFDHTRTWRHMSTDEGSAQCRGHLRGNTNKKYDNTIHAPIHSNKANMKGWLRRPNDSRGPCGPKASWHLSYRWRKTPKNLTQETCPDRGSNSGLLRDRLACYRHSGGLINYINKQMNKQIKLMSVIFTNIKCVYSFIFWSYLYQFVVILFHLYMVKVSTAVEQTVACAPVTLRTRVRFPIGTSFLS